MALSKPLSRFLSLWRPALALLIGTLSGMVAEAIGLPLPWMLGSMIGVTIAALGGAPIKSPIGLRIVFLPVLGVMLGSGIDADVLAAMGRWTITFIFLIPFSIATAIASYWFYRGVGRYDKPTAFFSAMPGGLNEMLLMGAAAGGDEKRIAMAHATRILAVVMFGVLFFGIVMGVSSARSTPSGGSLDSLSLQDWLILGGCALLGVRLALLLRLPAAPILGPMLLSGAAHISGLVTVAPPTLLVIVAQVVIGTIIGGRFVGATLRSVGRDMALGVGSSLVMIAVAVFFAWIVSSLSGTELSHTFLAYSPGGLTEMSLLALAMGQEVAYVSMMHVARITLVVFAAAPALRWLSRWRRASL